MNWGIGRSAEGVRPRCRGGARNGQLGEVQTEGTWTGMRARVAVHGKKTGCERRLMGVVCGCRACRTGVVPMLTLGGGMQAGVGASRGKGEREWGTSRRGALQMKWAHQRPRLPRGQCVEKSQAGTEALQGWVLCWRAHATLACWTQQCCWTGQAHWKKGVVVGGGGSGDAWGHGGTMLCGVDSQMKEGGREGEAREEQVGGEWRDGDTARQQRRNDTRVAWLGRSAGQPAQNCSKTAGADAKRGCRRRRGGGARGLGCVLFGFLLGGCKRQAELKQGQAW